MGIYTFKMITSKEGTKKVPRTAEELLMIKSFALDAKFLRQLLT